MSWLPWKDKKSDKNRSPPSRGNSPSPRERQASELLERVPGILSKNEDRSLFELPFQAPPDGRNVGMRIFLPREFPRDRPVLQLLQPVAHPWVSQYMQVEGHPEMASWRGAQSRSVADIVLEVQREFNAHCRGSSLSSNGAVAAAGAGGAHSGSWTSIHSSYTPMNSGSQYASPHYVHPNSGPHRSVSPAYGRQSATASRGFGPSGGGGGGGGPAEGSWSAYAASMQQPATMRLSSPVGQSRVQSQAEKPKGKEKHHTPIPAIPTTFDELEEMPYSNLKRLLEDDVARQSLVLSMPSVVGFTELRDQICCDNAQTAAENLKERERLMNLLSAASDLRDALQATCAEHKALVCQYQPAAEGDGSDHSLLRAIIRDKKEADDASEKLADDFLSGREEGLDHSAFVTQFLEKRRECHLLAAKAEALKQGMEGF